VEDAKIALNGVSTKPVRATEAENCLKGKKVSDETVGHAAETALKEIKPLSLVGCSSLVRRNFIRAMFEDLMDTIKTSR
jgi:CO/xanthine dehydrogenase FAD-binding subunit